jgi:GT2 family glycosyltransferase
MPTETAASRSYSRPAGSSGNILSVSIVSHGQGALVSGLLEDLGRCTEVPFEVILTINVPEPWAVSHEQYPFPLKVLSNTKRQGFGANHNAAFAHAKGEYFCILNPDIRLSGNPFPQLLGNFQGPKVGAVAPLIVSPEGRIEDHARRFPTPLSLLRKLITPTGVPDYDAAQGIFSPDWVAGMFVVFRREAFAAVAGFDEAYFLYYEDVDLCARLRQLGWDIVVDPSASAVHDARRESHRNPRYLLWHLQSMGRFLLRRMARRL